jgi:acetyl-CoA acetyltransferase
VIRREVAIVGIGQTAYGKALAAAGWDLAVEAVLVALRDAGLEPADVDGISRFAPPFEQVSEPMLVRALGIPELRFFAESPLGGEALGAVIAHAAAAIMAGLARVVVVYRALSQSRGGRFGRADRGGPSGTPATDALPARGATPAPPPGLARGATRVPPPSTDVVVPEEDNRSFAWPYGLMSPGQLFALWARRYAHVNKLTDDELTRSLGAIAITQRAYASRNPAAIMRDRAMTWDDYYAARMISEPLRLFDLCLENDGACAYVLTSAALARSLRDDPVYVLSATQTLSPYREPMGIYVPGELLELFPPQCAERLFAQAGVSRSDIDVAELYDATSYMPLRSLESYGFVRDGEAWRYVTETGTGPDSPLPVNTHGGHLSEAYLHGMNGVLEAVRQLRGTAVNQVPGAAVALVGAPAGSATILAR